MTWVSRWKRTWGWVFVIFGSAMVFLYFLDPLVGGDRGLEWWPALFAVLTASGLALLVQDRSDVDRENEAKANVGYFAAAMLEDLDGWNTPFRIIQEDGGDGHAQILEFQLGSLTSQEFEAMVATGRLPQPVGRSTLKLVSLISSYNRMTEKFLDFIVATAVQDDDSRSNRALGRMREIFERNINERIGEIRTACQAVIEASGHTSVP